MAALFVLLLADEARLRLLSVLVREWEKECCCDRCTLTPSTSRCSMFCTLRSNSDVEAPPDGKPLLMTRMREWKVRGRRSWAVGEVTVVGMIELTSRSSQRLERHYVISNASEHATAGGHYLSEVDEAR